MLQLEIAKIKNFVSFFALLSLCCNFVKNNNGQTIQLKCIHTVKN